MARDGKRGCKHKTDLDDILRYLKQFKKDIMASNAELSEKVDLLQSKLDTEQEQIAEKLSTLTGSVEELKATVAELKLLNTEGGTAEQRQAISDKLDAAIADIEGTITEEVPEE